MKSRNCQINLLGQEDILEKALQGAGAPPPFLAMYNCFAISLRRYHEPEQRVHVNRWKISASSYTALVWRRIVVVHSHVVLATLTLGHLYRNLPVKNYTGNCRGGLWRPDVLSIAPNQQCHMLAALLRPTSFKVGAWWWFVRWKRQMFCLLTIQSVPGTATSTACHYWQQMYCRLQAISRSSSNSLW